MIQVHVKLYANLRRHRPDLGIGETFICDVPEGTSVAGLSGEVLGMTREEIAIVLVNGVQRGGEYRLNAGDQVALWSPIAGG